MEQSCIYQSILECKSMELLVQNNILQKNLILTIYVSNILYIRFWLDATTINDVIDMPIQLSQITTPLSLKILPLLKTFLDLLQGFFMIANSFP